MTNQLRGRVSFEQSEEKNPFPGMRLRTHQEISVAIPIY